MLHIEAGPRSLRRLADGMDDRPYEAFTLVPLSPTIGAEIAGVDLSRPVADAVHAELHRALLEWKVLFFRDQWISGEQHRDFARLWGELEVHPFLPAGDVPEIVRFDRGTDNQGYENIWHSDVSWRELPSMGSLLRAIEVPAVGGDTMWADMGAAYDGLPDEIKEQIDAMTAVHDWEHSFGLAMNTEQKATMRDQYPPVEHPVVRTHPETGKRALYVNRTFTTRINELGDAESAAILDFLFAHCEHIDFQVRFRWERNDVAFWDNRCAMHRAVWDYWPRERKGRRVTIKGDRPS